MQKQFDLIVWDWDGTIADSTGMIVQALLKAAEQVGLPLLSQAQMRSIIGLGLREAIHRLYGDIPAEQARDLAKHYQVNYLANEETILLFDGVFETIKTLHQRGYKQAVATGKGRRGLNAALAYSGLGKFFKATRTVDECFSKPHPQMLDELMDELVIMPERTLMIGDTSYDLQMAKNAGVKSVGVTFGAQQATDWVNLDPIAQFDDFTSLSAWLLHQS
jgi:phosphoglycolate phosphatase